MLVNQLAKQQIMAANYGDTHLFRAGLSLTSIIGTLMLTGIFVFSKSIKQG
jgi:hypothetical protein